MSSEVVLPVFLFLSFVSSGCLQCLRFGLFSSLPLSQLYFNRLCILFHILKIPRKNTYITEFLFSVVLLFLLFLVQLRSCINPLHTAKVFRFCFFRGNFNFFNQKLVSSVFLFVCMREFITVFFNKSQVMITSAWREQSNSSGFDEDKVSTFFR